MYIINSTIFQRTVPWPKFGANLCRTSMDQALCGSNSFTAPKMMRCRRCYWPAPSFSLGAFFSLSKGLCASHGPWGCSSVQCYFQLLSHISCQIMDHFPTGNSQTSLKVARLKNPNVCSKLLKDWLAPLLVPCSTSKCAIEQLRAVATHLQNARKTVGALTVWGILIKWKELRSPKLERHIDMSTSKLNLAAVKLKNDESRS